MCLQIVSNARSFNPAKTRCHKCALSLQRNVSKITKAHEVDIRKAISILHPSTQQPATPLGSSMLLSGGDAMCPAMQLGSSAARLDSDVTSGTRGTSSAHAHAGALGLDSSRAAQSGSLYHPIKPEPSQSQQGLFASSVLGPAASLLPAPSTQPSLLPRSPLPLAPLEPMCLAMSDNEDEELLVQQHYNMVHDEQLLLSLPPLQPIEALMAGLRQPAVHLPWAHAPARTGSHAAGSLPAHAAPPSPRLTGQQLSSAAADWKLGDSQELLLCQLQLQGPGQVHTSPSMPGGGTAWQATRRGIELQCRWLELRMQVNISNNLSGLSSCVHVHHVCVHSCVHLQCVCWSIIASLL